MSAEASRDFRLVALDIDGTVLNDSQQVTPALKNALGALPELGVRTVLCTGRRWRTTCAVLDQLEHAHPVAVCCGGGLIKRADDEKTLYADPMPHALAREAVGLFREGGLAPLLLYDRPLEGRELKVSEADRDCSARMPYLEVNRHCAEWYAGDYPDGDELPLEVYTVDEERYVRPAEERLMRTMGSRSVVEAMDQRRYGETQRALEAHGLSTTKWNALRWLLERWDVRPEEVVAFGDDVNDVPMLEAAGLSFAMGNALPEVKAAADEVTGSNEEDGVATALAQVFPALR